MGMGEGVGMEAVGAGRALADHLLIVAGGGVEAVADELKDGRQTTWTEPWRKLQEDEAERMAKAAGSPCGVVDEVGYLTAEGVADDKPTGRTAEGTASARRNGTAAHTQGEDVEWRREREENVLGP